MNRRLDDYVDVATRIAAFKEKHPDGSLQSELVEFTDKRVVVKAYAYRDRDDKVPAVGHAAEVIPHPNANMRGSELMVCETSAWGRAIAALGFEVKRGVATREEVASAEARTSAPVSEPVPVAPPLHEDERLTNVWIDDERNAAVISPEFELATKLAAQAKADEAGLCPTHRRPWRYRDGGISKTTGKAFEGFWSCDAPKDASGYCKLRPAMGWVNAQVGRR